MAGPQHDFHRPPQVDFRRLHKRQKGGKGRYEGRPMGGGGNGGGGGGKPGKGQFGKVRQYFQDQNNPQDLPFSAEYDSTVAGLRRDRDYATSGLAYDAQRLESTYGFNNPAANPYSRASLLQKSYDQNNAGVINSSAAAGQLYSGSTQRGLDSALSDYGSALNTERMNYADAQRDLTDRGVGIGLDYTEGLASAEAARLAEALEQAVDPSEAPSRPTFVKKYLKKQKKQLRKYEKNDKDRKAQALREKLRKLGING